MRDFGEPFLATTDAGSLPLRDDFQTGRENVKRASLDKISTGLDYPCYPQLMGVADKPMSMTLQFLIPLSESGCGIEIKGGKAYLAGKLSKPDRVIGIERAKFFRDFLGEKKLLKRIKGIKACVTGPFTLASGIDSDDILKCGASKTDVVSVLADVVAEASRELDRLGFRIVTVDEPFLGSMLGRRILYNYDLGFVVEILDSVLKKISNFSAVHVCGTITPLVKKVMLESITDIIDHEFEGTPTNLGIYSRQDIEANDKFVAFGCVSSNKADVESVDQIKVSIKRGLDHFGEHLIVKPDCGFGGLIGTPSAYEIAIQKLRNMVQAARELRGRTRQ